MLQELHTTLGQVADEQSVLTDQMKSLLDTHSRSTDVLVKKLVTPFGTFLMSVEVKSSQVQW